MDRDAELPDRCVACNAPALGFRLKRNLHYSPLAWRIGASLGPFIVLLIGTYANLRPVTLAFLPLLALVIVVHFFVRKGARVKIGVCTRHRSLRTTLISLTWICAAGALFAGAIHPLAWLASLAGLILLWLAQSYVGAQAVRLVELSERHAWLTGTGSAFRATLPELN